MKSGNIIEYMDDGNIVLGYILSVESVSAAGRKKENFRIVTEKNKITNITASKIINCEQSHISEKTNQAAIASRLIEMRERRRQMAQSVPLAEIRELIMLESQQAFGAREIAAAYYGANFTNDEASAVVRNIFVKNPYFKRKEDYFFPASDEDVARFLDRRGKGRFKNASRRSSRATWRISNRAVMHLTRANFSLKNIRRKSSF